MVVTTLEQICDRGLSITGKAIAAISGGQFVKCISGPTTAGSAAPDAVLQFDLCDAAGDEDNAAGIALNTTPSGENVTVGLRGVYRVGAEEAISEGEGVMVGASTTARCVKICDDYTSGIGWALNPAASGENIFIVLNKVGYTA